MEIVTQEVPVRHHPRVEAGFLVRLFVDGKTQVARAEDLSMAGIKILGEFAPAGDRVTLAIPLPHDREIVTLGTVIRCRKDEMAVEFDQLDWDDLFALARYLHPRMT